MHIENYYRQFRDKAIGERQNFKIDPKSCSSVLSDSLNSLPSLNFRSIWGKLHFIFNSLLFQLSLIVFTIYCTLLSHSLNLSLNMDAINGDSHHFNKLYLWLALSVTFQHAMEKIVLKCLFVKTIEIIIIY